MTADSNDPKVHDDSETQALLDHIAYEVVLITRYAAQNLPTIKRKSIMDRSALILLARLKAQGPMTVNELAEAFGLNVSTVHRQLKAAIEIGRAHVCTPVTLPSRLPSSSCNI